MTGGIGNWLSNGFSNWGKNLMNNPDKTAIMMDQLGSGFWSGADGKSFCRYWYFNGAV